MLSTKNFTLTTIPGRGRCTCATTRTVALSLVRPSGEVRRMAKPVAGTPGAVPLSWAPAGTAIMQSSSAKIAFIPGNPKESDGGEISILDEVRGGRFRQQLEGHDRRLIQ